MVLIFLSLRRDLTCLFSCWRRRLVSGTQNDIVFCGIVLWGMIKIYSLDLTLAYILDHAVHCASAASSSKCPNLFRWTKSSPELSQGIVMMCIPFVCLWGCLVGSLLYVGWLSVGWNSFLSLSFSFLLSLLFQSHALLCPDARVFTWRKCIQVGQKDPGRSEGCGVLCKRQQSLDVFDTLLRELVIFYSYSLLCIIVDCQDDLYCGVHVRWCITEKIVSLLLFLLYTRVTTTV